MAVVGFAEMHQQAISKACKSILVGNEQHCHLSCKDGINQSQKLLPLEIESPTNFTDPFIDHITVRFTKLGQYPFSKQVDLSNAGRHVGQLP